MILPLLLALSVTASDAICAVRGWTRQGGTLATIGAPVKADRFETSAGNAFYAVGTSQGTVFVSADTDFDPILAFTSSTTDFSSLDPASPLWALLTRSVDLAGYNPDAFARWQELLAAGALRRMLLGAAQGITSIGDVRVDPLVTSKWSQSTAGNYQGGNICYNYYTPGNSVCGCVATAMAQILYYHKYPTSAVSAKTEKCWYNGTAESYTMKGGVYEWAKMMDDPPKDAADEVCEAIGKLTYDCGVATHMQWRPTFSGTYGCYAETAFYSNFFYRSATYTDCSDILTTANLGKALLSNLDAGYPAMLGISGLSGGHSIVADGYGFQGDDLYIHLNMGWAGYDDCWYKLPKLNTSNYSFSCVDEIVYNIIPGTTIKGVFSGRIVDATGQPVSNKQVRICRYNNNSVITNLTTNAHGVYGFAYTAMPNNIKVVLAADDTYEALASSQCTLTLPGAHQVLYGGADGELEAATIRAVRNSANLGNSWGNDLTLAAHPVPVVLAPASTGSGASVSSGTELAIDPAWFVTYGYASSVSDTEAIQAAATQTAANGINSVAECWVIGISPTNENEKFTASISFDSEGNPQIDYDPNLGSERTYRKLCSYDLKSWREWNGKESANFFKVEVSK